MREDATKHLELIQAVITRMAGNSFLLKGWAVTLSAALFALGAQNANPAFPLLALFPALSFWGLDAHYLRQERLFRKLYDWIRLATDDELDATEPFSMSTAECEGQVATWAQTVKAPTIAWLHGVVVGACIVVFVVLCSQ